jgi:hypothetical protein
MLNSECRQLKCTRQNVQNCPIIPVEFQLLSLRKRIQISLEIYDS